MTGGPKGGLHVTDVTNASRTLLMNIETLNWDPLLTKTFSVSPSILPEIRSSADIVGPVSDGCILNGIPISGVRSVILVGELIMKISVKISLGSGKSTIFADWSMLPETWSD